MTVTFPCSSHTVAPESYLAWHEWAEAMYRTHVQERCPDCGRFEVWRRRRPVCQRVVRRLVQGGA